jgi:hypothetical protein
VAAKSPPAQDPGPVGPVVEWKLRAPGSVGEEQTYEQTELSIEGEARLLGMARKIGTLLRENEFDLDEASKMLEVGNPNWALIENGVSIVVENAPQLVAETAAILLSIYPTDEDGSPNPEYEGHIKFLRRSVNLAKINDMIRVFIRQNDYQRIAGPFFTRFRSSATPEPETPATVTEGSSS